MCLLRMYVLASQRDERNNCGLRFDRRRCLESSPILLGLCSAKLGKDKLCNQALITVQA